VPSVLFEPHAQVAGAVMALPAADDDARKADGTRAFRHEPQEAGQVCGGVRSFEIADSLALDVDAHRVDVRVARLWHEYGGDPMPHPLSSAAATDRPESLLVVALADNL